MKDRKIERWIKENVEAIAIAIVMALVIRQFAIEAFKIPTESMAPTLLGDTRGGGTGDRILVFKVPYLLGEPSRWDVVVFKFPLNESKNYIKRLVGLGGETLRILDGDIIVNGEIARKPPHVQEAMFLEEYPGRHGKNYRRNLWLTDGIWHRTDSGGFRAEAAGGESLARYSRKLPGGDVRLTAEVTPDRGEVIFRIVENGVVADLVLAVGEGGSYVQREGERFPLPKITLPAGEATEVRFTNVDDTILVDVRGETFRLEYDSIARRQGEDRVLFGVRAGSATFEDVVLERDVHYLADGTGLIKVPEDHFFVLGDNTGNSADSRRWTLRKMTLRDGTVYEYSGEPPEDVSQRPKSERGYEIFMDRTGFWRKVREADIVNRSTRPHPFVSRDLMIGRAFFVFWPLNPFTHQFRLKFIR